MFNNSLSRKDIDFKTLENFENFVFEYVCNIGLEIIKYLFKVTDRHIMLTRDRKVYRHKGYKPTCIKTVMGPVNYKRVAYMQTDEKGEEQCRYLLDEYLGIEKIGLMSTNLVEKVIENTTHKVKKAVKTNVYPVRRGGMLFKGCPLTEGMKVVKRFINGDTIIGSM